MPKISARAASTAALAGLALAILAFAPPAHAGGPPQHPPAGDPIGGFALDHACGVAADSAGNLYVSSASEDKIEVFDPAGAHLTSISNTNEPCGLAVDSQGTLFATERTGGKVVRYAPGEQPPFAGTPTYGPREEVDASGEATGIAVDPFDDRLYVAKGGRVDIYDSEGQLTIDEVQRIFPFGATGGTYKLSFGGQETASLDYEATHLEVEEALEDLAAIGAGDVSVSQGPDASERDHLIAFTGSLATMDVPAIVCDKTGLEGPAECFMATQIDGFNGHIGEGELSEATGVAAYTYRVDNENRTRYVFVADAQGDVLKIFSGSNIRKLSLRREIEGIDHDFDPETPDQELGFGVAGASLAVDPGNRAANDTCAKVGIQACTAGHLVFYNNAQGAVEEFDATGEFLDRIVSEEFEDAEPTGLAVERSGGAHDGRVYVTAGAGPGARVLAFEPLVEPERRLLPELSKVLIGAKGVAVDPFGDVYVAAGPNVYVFDPEGNPVTFIEDARLPFDVAVDSQCNVYVLDGAPGDEQMTYYEATACPPSSGTGFSRREPPVMSSPSGLKGVAVNPLDDHAFVLRAGTPKPVAEFAPAQEGSGQLRECGAGSVGGGNGTDIAVYGKGEGEVRAYLAANPRRLVAIDCGPAEGAEEVVAETAGGGGCPSGEFGDNPAIGVDQSSGHVLTFSPFEELGHSAREYDAALSCVAEYGSFANNFAGNYAIAIDNGPTSPNRGVAYVAFDGANEAVQPFDLTAFTPLGYGGPPEAETGIADGISGGAATLRGTVDPNGFEVESCEFEYLLDSAYEQNLGEAKEGFEGAVTAPCAEDSEAIGSGEVPVLVHAELAGLQAGQRYRFRLLAKNEFGPSDGGTWLFGPPLLAGEEARPVLYDEATLRATVDPSGLATEYFFEYGTSATYGQATAAVTLPPGDGPVPIEAPLSGLVEGQEYHFRLLATNEAGGPAGPDRIFETQERLRIRSCPNTPYRTGLSAKLPDCRAYELVTPPDTRGSAPTASISPTADTGLNNWLVDPRGPGAGESVGYFAATLPGFEGTGESDGYRATRPPGDHPAAGWQTEFYGPSYAQLGGGTGNQQEGVSADQRYWMWFSAAELFPALLPIGHYMRVPDGEANIACNLDPEIFQDEFELLGCGSAGTDPQARRRFVSPGGEHVVFVSSAALEPEAPLGGIRSIYDRKAGQASAELISVDPEGDPFGSDATFVAASEDGSTILFHVAGTLYAHRGGQTVELVAGPHAFAGVSEDGSRAFYANGASGGAPAGLFACDLETTDPCEEFAEEAIFAGVAPGGRHAYFSSEEELPVLPGSEPNENGEEATAGEPNLYAWDGTDTRFVAVLDENDIAAGGLATWVDAIDSSSEVGRGNAAVRATPDGSVFLFQSRARLTAYDNEDAVQVYRYEPLAPAGERLLCVSCDPTGAPPGGGALLQVFAGNAGGRTVESTMLPNVTDDGATVFFHSPDRLLSEDANGVIDVYQWRAHGAGEGSEECGRTRGCLALISSGQGEEQSTLYGMSADGRDVFISTAERFVGSDLPGSHSLYDARVEGGIPDPPAPAPCQGDACQGEGTPRPALPAPGTSAPLGDGNVPPQGKKPGKKRCAKGKRQVKRKGKARCVKTQTKKRKRGGPRAGR